eukprot:915394-Alexandrium_andersonii.AAC.1
MTASHEANWLTVDGDVRSISYDQGSIPGDPWGDLFYGLLQARVTWEIREELLRQGIAVKLKMRGPGWAADPAAPPPGGRHHGHR